ncbi:hypothetical protein, partial [Arthrobacter sp. E3]|uniref:hypothetical protein n=1 Tax=Arthrobacter sp. E3 TaxID=517402 RepID=UPI001A942131
MTHNQDTPASRPNIDGSTSPETVVDGNSAPVAGEVRPAYIRFFQGTKDTYAKTISPAFKFILGVAAITTAITAILAFAPMAFNTAFPRVRAADTLQSLHAGYTLDVFKEKLGAPTMIKRVSLEPEITEIGYPCNCRDVGGCAYCVAHDGCASGGPGFSGIIARTAGMVPV